MSLETTTYVLNRRFGNQIRKLIMIAIADYTSDDTGTGWAFIDTLAARAECSRRSVQEHIEILESEGELEIYRNAGPKGSHRFKILKKESPPEQVSKRGANPAPVQMTGADDCKGVQMSGAQTAKRGANGRRSLAPKTIEQEENNREREKRERVEFSPDQFCDVFDGINSLRPEWQATEKFSAKERRAFIDNVEALSAFADASRCEIVRRYLAARLPQGSAGFQPVSREHFLSTSNDVLTYALQWHRKQAKPAVAKPLPAPPTPGEELTRGEIKALLDLKS
jgi:hypothetical protein